MRLVFAISSTAGFDDGALGSFHDSRRGTQFLQRATPPRWRASRRPNGASCASPSRARPAASRRLRAAAVRALFEQRLLPLASGVDAAFVALWWLHSFRSFTMPRSLFDCLVDRFGKPLRRFNALAPLDARLSGSQRNANVSRTRPGLLPARLVAAALRERLFSPTASCLPTAARFWRRGAPTRARAAACRATTAATPPSALASCGSSDDGGDLLRAVAQAARGRRAARARLPA
jgi:hypothetical protein